MNLNSCRNHESLRQKRQESWISRFKWFRFYPRYNPRQKTLKTSVLGDMHIAATSPLCSVVKKGSLGKRICYKEHTAKPLYPPTNHSQHPEQMFEHPNPHRLLKLSSYLEFHHRFLLLKPNGNSGSILKEICHLESSASDITWTSFLNVCSFLDGLKTQII